MGKYLCQVTAADGAETMNAHAELVHRGRERLTQCRHAQVGYALAQVGEKFMHAAVGFERARLDFRRRRLDVLDQDRLPFGAHRRQHAVFRVLDHEALVWLAIERAGGFQENLGVWFALADFIATNGDVEVLQHVGVDQVFLGDGTAAGGGHRHGQARLAQALQHLQQAGLDRYAVIAHVLQFKFIGALADFGVREVVAVMRLGKGLGLLCAQAQRANQGVLAQRFAEDFQRSLLECLEAQALGVEEGAIHIEDGAENVFTVKEKHWLLPLVVASGTPPATGEYGV